MRLPDNATAEDAGFTLLEILVASMITAVILTVLTASFLVFFQNSTYTSGRDDHAAGAEALSSWLDRDLASATTDTPPVISAATACTASPVLLSLSWTVYTPGSQPNSFPSKGGTSYRSDYAFKPDSLNATLCMITRTLYSGPAAGPLTAKSTLELMHDLIGTTSGTPNLITSTAPTTKCSAPNRAVTLTLQQYHSSTSTDAAVPFTYFGCVNARTNALPTPSPT